VISECTYQGKQYCYPIGTNSVGLFYNKAMLKAAGLQPPTTWDELAADAKKLTKPPVYGMTSDATADEQSTCQLEPFFWSNGASLTNVDSRRSSRPCSCGSTWSRTVRPPSPC